MNEHRLLVLSAIGWIIFMLLGWLHALPLFNLMPAAGEKVIAVARVITWLGNPTTLIYATAGMVLYLLYTQRSWLLPGMLTFTMLIGWWLMDAFKSWWAIPRPLGEQLVVATDFSYPSGHAMMSLIFYGFLAWYLAKAGRPRIWSLLLILVAVLIGISRPLLNVHFPADVIGGWGAGLGWLTLNLWIYYQLLKRMEKKAEQ